MSVTTWLGCPSVRRDPVKRRTPVPSDSGHMAILGWPTVFCLRVEPV